MSGGIALDPGGIIATTLARAPLAAMDVGAAGGVAPHWRDHLAVMEVDCFEPDEADAPVARRESPPNIHWFPVALAGAAACVPSTFSTAVPGLRCSHPTRR